jgi:hypothetical protein
MKQLLSLFLILLPCLAWAQYPSNGNQKITLGEQTTADGLIYRGVAATDTVRKPSIDTMAYMVLDTTTNIMWHYKKATSNAWLRLNLLPSDTASFNYVNTYGTQTVGGAKTFTSTLTATRFDPTSSTATGNGLFLPSTNTLGFSTDGVNRVTLNANGNIGVGTTPLNIGGAAKWITLEGTAYGGGLVSSVNGIAKSAYYYEGGFGYFQGFAGVGVQFLSSNTIAVTVDTFQRLGIGTASPTEKLHVVGNARITAVGAGAYANDLNITSTGVLTTASSDEKYKYNILPINYGLNTILQLKPVNFQWIEGEEEDLGFIAQDVAEIIPEAVNTNWNSDLLFRYESLIPILTKAIQEQQALIKALEQRIINLENK